eukprot:3996608-Pleurochrysis_carterae.AAC.2
MRRRRRAALARRSSSQLRLYSEGGGSEAAFGADEGRTKGASREVFAAEVEAPAEAALRRCLAGWLRTNGEGCVREKGVPHAAASSGLSSSQGRSIRTLVVRNVRGQVFSYQDDAKQGAICGDLSALQSLSVLGRDGLKYART